MRFELTLREVSGEYLWPRRPWIDNAAEAGANAMARQFLQIESWALFKHYVAGVMSTTDRTLRSHGAVPKTFAGYMSFVSPSNPDKRL
jgi:hypothetical protein